MIVFQALGFPSGDIGNNISGTLGCVSQAQGVRLVILELVLEAVGFPSGNVCDSISSTGVSVW